MVSGDTFFASQRMKKISSLLRIPMQKYLPQGGARPAAREKSLTLHSGKRNKKPIQWMSFSHFSGAVGEI